MSNVCALQLQLKDKKIESIGSKQVIRFDDLIGEIGNQLEYNAQTGEIGILKKGVYYVQWFVEVDGMISEQDVYVCFSLMSDEGKLIKAASYNTTGQLVGNAILKVEKTPVIIKLINDTDGQIIFGQTPIKANINVIEIDVGNTDVKLIKTCDKNVARVEERLKYTLQITNEGSYEVTEVIVRDLLERGIDFIEGSVVIDGYPRPKENILGGINVGGLSIGVTKQIEFEVEVTEYAEDCVSNQAEAILIYKEQQISNPYIEKIVSDISRVAIQHPQLMIQKIATKQEVKIGETVAYSIRLLNTGDTKLIDVILQDEISKSVRLIANSLTVNNQIINNPDLTKGINIGEIGSGEEVDVYYQVKVISGGMHERIINRARAIYRYVLWNQETDMLMTKWSVAEVEVTNTQFRQTWISFVAQLPQDKPKIGEVSEKTGRVEILETHIINSWVKNSYKGEILKAYKLIVSGEIQVEIEYTGDNLVRGMYVEQFTTPFTESILLALDYSEEFPVVVRTEIEEIEIEKMGDRTFAVDIGLFIGVRVGC